MIRFSFPGRVMEIGDGEYSTSPVVGVQVEGGRMLRFPVSRDVCAAVGQSGLFLKPGQKVTVELGRPLPELPRSPRQLPPIDRVAKLESAAEELLEEHGRPAPDPDLLERKREALRRALDELDYDGMVMGETLELQP